MKAAAALLVASAFLLGGCTAVVVGATVVGAGVAVASTAVKGTVLVGKGVVGAASAVIPDDEDEEAPAKKDE